MAMVVSHNVARSMNMVRLVISFGSLLLILFDLLGTVTESSLGVGLASTDGHGLDSELDSVLRELGA